MKRFDRDQRSVDHRGLSGLPEWWTLKTLETSRCSAAVDAQRKDHGQAREECFFLSPLIHGSVWVR